MTTDAVDPRLHRAREERLKAEGESSLPLPRYRSATLHDELLVTSLFSRMLRELEPLGHDVLPTEHNVDLMWDQVFAPAIATGRPHGIVLAFVDNACVGATFFVPERNVLDVPPGRAVAHGIYVVPEHRQRKLAWVMQCYAHGQLAQAGCVKLISHVAGRNDAGMRSAASAGAQVTGVQTTVDLTSTEEHD